MNIYICIYIFVNPIISSLPIVSLLKSISPPHCPLCPPSTHDHSQRHSAGVDAGERALHMVRRHVHRTCSPAWCTHGGRARMWVVAGQQGVAMRTTAFMPLRFFAPTPIFYVSLSTSSLSQIYK